MLRGRVFSPRGWFAAVAVAFGICHASAATLGNAEGQVLIGRPLDLSFSTSGHGEGEPPCLEAELMHGDTRIDPRRVAVQWVPGPQGRGTVHVRSAVRVFEPVVTLVVRVGCLRELTRRYVLLADPAEPEPLHATVPVVPVAPAVPTAPAAVATPVAPASPEVAGSPSGPLAPATATAVPVPRAQPSTPSVRPAARVRRPGPARAQGPVFRQAAPAARAATPSPAGRRTLAQAPAAAASRPRLVLDPPELAPQQQATPAAAASRPATAQAQVAAAAAPASGPTLGTGSTQGQAPAVASAASAAASAPDAAAQNAQRIQALERDLAALVEQSRKSNEMLDRMGQQLKQARDERDFMSRLLAAGAVLLALAAVLWAWLRRRSGRVADRWWQESEAPEIDEAEGKPQRVEPPQAGAAVAAGAAAPVPKPAAAPAPSVADSLPARVSARALLDERVTTPDNPETVPGVSPAEAARLEDERPRATHPMPLAEPAAGASRTVQADELMDIRQQADFFISIGRHQHAFALLNAQHDDSQQTGPLAWLDLLDMYQALGRASDFDRVRKAFERNFNATVPEMDDYNRRGSLESHARLVDRICEHWPKRRVLDVMEEALFRRHGETDTKRLDLWAFRDLLFLYQVGRDLVEEDVGPMARDTTVNRPAAGPEVEAVPTYLDHDHFDTTPVPDSELSWPAGDSSLDLDLGALDGDQPPPVAPVEAAGDKPPSALDATVVMQPPAPAEARDTGVDLDFDVWQSEVARQLRKR